MSGERLSVFVPGVLRNLDNGRQGNARGAYFAKSRYRRAWRDKVRLYVGSVATAAKWRAAPATPKRITLLARTWNEMDAAGLAAALKPVEDGLVDAKILHDDRPSAGHVIVREQVRDRRRRGVDIMVSVL